MRKYLRKNFIGGAHHQIYFLILPSAKFTINSNKIKYYVIISNYYIIMQFKNLIS